MISLFHQLFVFHLLWSRLAMAITCDDDEVYALFVKKTIDYSNEESFTVMDGETTLFSSPSLYDNEENRIEACLPVVPSHTYTLQMKDSYGDSWSDGAWLEIYGVNNNRALKVMMMESNSETVNFAMYAPINKGDEWKYTDFFRDDWMTAYNPDDYWRDVSFQMDLESEALTQYYRKSFAGLDNMAAIEVAFFYRFGIVAYINGQEVYRDNMPAGEVSNCTVANGIYSDYDYRGIYRSAAVASNSTNILAVELHSFDYDPLQVNLFDAYLAYYSGIKSSNHCFVVPVDFNATSFEFYYPERAVSWSRESYSESDTLPASILLTTNSTILPMVSSIRILTDSERYNSFFFSVVGSTSEFEPVTEVYGPGFIDYDDAGMWAQYDRATQSVPYSTYRITLRENIRASIQLNEIQFMVCNRPSPIFEYPSISYTLYVNQQVKIAPTEYGFTSCFADPPLPNGLSLELGTCSIIGVARAPLSETSFTITNTESESTTVITLEVVECASSLYKMVRTYQTWAIREFFSIQDTQNDSVIFEVEQGHNAKPGVEWMDYVCIDQDAFYVRVNSTLEKWKRNSYLYLYYTISADDEEMVLKARYDPLVVDDVYYLRRPSIAASSNWLYKMDTVPSNWYSESASTADWSVGAKGSFPSSASGIQLYRQSFSIDSISDVKGVILSIRYKYGCVVYLNGAEAWRNGVDGDVTVGSTATNSYSELKYRVITLPSQTLSSTEYLKGGNNIIAIALVNPSYALQSTFDAVIRLMPTPSETHVWEYTADGEDVYDPEYPFDFDSDYGMTPARCSRNHAILTLKDDRREWISSIELSSSYSTLPHVITRFRVYGRNSGNWELLRDVMDLVYLSKGDKKRIYLTTDTPYNQFKFENMSDETSECDWNAQSIILFADARRLPSELVYPSEASLVKNITMMPIIPEGEVYYSFEIRPALPKGLRFDPQTGWIAGMPTEATPSVVYTITARPLIGATVMKTMTLSVGDCTGDRSLITFRFFTDSYPEETSWKLFSGRGTRGSVIQSQDTIPIQLDYYNASFCLPYGIYTFQVLDQYSDGMEFGSGYTMTVDDGEMELDIGVLARAKPYSVSVSTVFSSYLPFQMQKTDWKVYQGEVPSDWTAASFDDSAWLVTKATDIPIADVITTYIRKSFQLIGIADYSVMNIRVKYVGGVAVYFNGNRVARFNLEEELDTSTEPIADEMVTKYSKFHIILSAAGVVEGTNVMAFELHRFANMTSDPVVFDATGVFGVDDCSTVIDSYSDIAMTNDAPLILDLDPSHYHYLYFKRKTFIEWTVENMEGSKWNSFNMIIDEDCYGEPSRCTRWYFNLSFDPDEPKDKPVTVPFQGIVIPENTKPQLSVPVAMTGFRKVHWEMTGFKAGSYNVASMFTAYCKPVGAVCPGIGEYATVKEGEKSYASCPSGHYGYTYRVCTGGVLGEVQYDKCSAIPTDSCPATSQFESSPIDSTVSIACGGQEIGEKTYACQKTTTEVKWIQTDSTCRSPDPSMGTVLIAFEIHFIGMIEKKYQSIVIVIRTIISTILGINMRYAIVWRWGYDIRRLDDSSVFEVRIVANVNDLDLIQRALSLNAESIADEGKKREPDAFPSTSSADFMVNPYVILPKIACTSDFMAVVFNKAEDGVKCQVRVSDAMKKPDGLVMIDSLTFAAGYCLNPGYYYVGCDGATRVSWTVIPKSITSAGDLKPNTLDLTASPHGAMFKVEKEVV